jgi:hypothetical protein
MTRQFYFLNEDLAGLNHLLNLHGVLKTQRAAIKAARCRRGHTELTSRRLNYLSGAGVAKTHDQYDLCLTLFGASAANGGTLAPCLHVCFHLHRIISLKIMCDGLMERLEYHKLLTL